LKYFSWLVCILSKLFCDAISIGIFQSFQIALTSISKIQDDPVNTTFDTFSDQQGSGMATAGVYTYFFWVLLQPFRGNPEYKDVADLVSILSNFLRL
jgi:hypothetical protein